MRWRGWFGIDGCIFTGHRQAGSIVTVMGIYWVSWRLTFEHVKHCMALCEEKDTVAPDMQTAMRTTRSGMGFHHLSLEGPGWKRLTAGHDCLRL